MTKTANNQADIELLLREGEGYHLEFKEDVEKSIARDMVAFANSSGGRIIVGVDDHGAVVGVKDVNRTKAALVDIARNCDPALRIAVETVHHEDGDILVASVAEGDDKPYSCSAGFFTRVGPTSEKLSRSEIVSTAIAGGRVRFDEQLRPDFRWPRDADKTRMRRFAEMSGLRRISSFETLIENLGLGIRQKGGMVVNNACVLLFAKEPQRFVRQNVVTCVRYRGTTKYEVIDRKDFNADLISNYDDALAFLKQYTAVRYIIKTSRRQEVRDIPEAVLREALANAIIHRDYFDARLGVMIDMYDDRVVIYNPGLLPEAVKKRFGEKSYPRNPLVFDAFHRVGLAEKIGSGISRMRMDLQQAGLPEPVFELNELFFLELKKAQEKGVGERGGITGGITGGLTGGLKTLVNHLAAHSGQRANQIARELDVPHDTIEKQLRVLKKAGMVEYRGSKKTGGYYRSES